MTWGLSRGRGEGSGPREGMGMVGWRATVEMVEGPGCDGWRMATSREEAETAREGIVKEAREMAALRPTGTKESRKRKHPS